MEGFLIDSPTTGRVVRQQGPAVRAFAAVEVADGIICPLMHHQHAAGVGRRVAPGQGEQRRHRPLQWQQVLWGSQPGGAREAIAGCVALDRAGNLQVGAVGPVGRAH